MGQFSPLGRATSTHPNMGHGPPGLLPAGATTITATFKNQTLDAGGNAAVFARLYYSATPDMASPTQIGVQTSTFDSLAVPHQFAFSTGGVPSGSYIAPYFGSNTSGNTNSMDMYLEDGLTYCQYGTSPQGSTTSGVIITTGLIDLMLLAVGVGPWAAIVFDTFVGSVLWGGNLCAGLPPVMPNFDNTDFIGGLPNVADPRSRDKFWTALQCVAWPYFCQCNPGPPLSPAPNPPPPPVWVKPDPAPVGPTIVDCDGADLCALLNGLARQIAAQTAMLAAVQTTTTLIQREGVPFGMVPGVLHTGLSGAGSFAIQGLIALEVTVNSAPGYLSSDM
jgi:hypothetical protein